MKYIKLQNGKIIECADENYQNILLENENSEELSKDDAYAFLFVKISNKMANQFSNYNYIDIASELFYILLRTYKERGNYAKINHLMIMQEYGGQSQEKTVFI